MSNARAISSVGSRLGADVSPHAEAGPRVAIIQSNYIPWKGYFDIVHDVDLFIFLDDVQFTRQDWRNRNKVKTQAGPRWLSIPVGRKNRLRTCDVPLPATDWQADHWQKISEAYRRSPYWNTYKDYFEPYYLGRRWSYLAEFNQALLVGIARDLLGLTTRFEDSRDYAVTETRAGRVLSLLQKVGAREYVSGPLAKAYLTDEMMASIGVQLTWKSYEGYPEYPQPHPPFVHGLTILDLLFNTGPDAPYYIWGWRDEAAWRARKAS